MFREHSNLILSNDERAKLKTEFEQLETIDQKYEFWKNRFNYDYSQHYSLEQLSIEDFIIIPKNPDETAVINKLLFENYLSFFGNMIDEILESRKTKFVKSVATSLSKEALIEYELIEINEHITKLKDPLPRNKSFGLGLSYTKNASEWFFLGYEEYLINRKEFDWTEKLYHPKSIKDMLHGIEWAKYREFVKNYLRSKKNRDDIQLNGEQKFLVLHYLGFGKEIDKNTNRSKLYEFFIDELSYNSIRPMFSDITLFETEENLNTIISLFKLLKLDSIARDIQEKLPNKNKDKQRK